jgi:transposase
MSEMSTIWAKEYNVAPILLMTLNNWFELILYSFMERWTNVFAEGVNNRIKMFKQHTFGFTSFDHFA